MEYEYKNISNLNYEIESKSDDLVVYHDINYVHFDSILGNIKIRMFDIRQTYNYKIYDINVVDANSIAMYAEDKSSLIKIHSKNNEFYLYKDVEYEFQFILYDTNNNEIYCNNQCIVQYNIDKNELITSKKDNKITIYSENVVDFTNISIKFTKNQKYSTLSKT